jgi:hypothetical protein
MNTTPAVCLPPAGFPALVGPLPAQGRGEASDPSCAPNAIAGLDKRLRDRTA